MYCTGYVDDLMDMIMENVLVDPSLYRAEILKMNIPSDLSSEYEHPDHPRRGSSAATSQDSMKGSWFEASVSSMGVRKLLLYPKHNT